ncbi:sugar ABC transporter ATP-binding protein [Devosia sp.]|uniref:sugar ABC transporter ATP-binding protein n=1 Tax=Devosia sp. TaxID=1871048 RepID=UPI0019F1D70E|nr:sugar ABC transporter ATP-binding protein [Devosia sp.]MBE0579688.1 sugar ABC transporter ATP-binding protein [Devosia sp.]
MNDQRDNPVLAVNGASKSFGAVRALNGLSFALAAGECVGLVGHNGAGKSTLVGIMNGGTRPDSGTIHLGGNDETGRYSVAVARKYGLRCVFQELSLCPNLTVTENARIAHASISGFGWRRRAERVVRSKLDEIFPGHGIDCDQAVGTLSIAQRQMVEIAMAFSESDGPARIVILDEPTSSLDANIARQMLDHIRKFVGGGGSVVLISHILSEILTTTDRIVVMKDGGLVAEGPSSRFTMETLVGAMGSVVRARDAAAPPRDRTGTTPALTRRGTDGAPEFRAYAGEIVGLAGLGGHGQTETLVELYRGFGGDWLAPADVKAAFVAGDRHVDGNLPMWSILRNISITLLTDLTRAGIVRDGDERAVAQSWRERIGIRTDSLDNPILSLSGGNQQKVLFSRALATRAPVVLMDDPMRGVDIGTKQEVYAMLRAEADRGRTFVWYSTEIDEICQCDRVYVFREGRIVVELTGADIREDRVLAASFSTEAA